MVFDEDSKQLEIRERSERIRKLALILKIKLLSLTGPEQTGGPVQLRDVEEKQIESGSN